MVEYFSQLEKEGGPGAPEFLSSHPNPGNRAKNVADTIAKFPKKQYRASDQRYQQIHQVAQKLDAVSMQEVAQKAQQQGQVGSVNPEDIRPSGQFRGLDHNLFRIEYPSNWEVFGNQNSTVTIAPRAGVSESAIAYGVMVSGFRPQQSNTLEGATRELIQTLLQGNPQMRAIGNAQEVSVGGTRGLTVALQGPSPISTNQGPLAERDQLVTVPHGDGTILFLLFIAPERDLQALSPTYQRMLQSFQLKR
jgi:hypothetical protein